MMEISKLTFLDLFSGIGGFRLGMERAGHECVGWAEWDKFARKSYQAIFDKKEVWNANDIRSVKSDELPRADCWCFGFPCQDISVAGKRQGITKGKRSSLFFTVTSLIRDLQGEDRPSYLFIENVKNLLSINRGFDFLKLQIELDEIGYDLEWSVLDSAEVVPQHTERLFIIGHLRGRSTRKVFPIRQESSSPTEPNKISVVANTSRTNYKSHDVYDPKGIITTLTARDYKGPNQVAIKRVVDGRKDEGFGTRDVYDPDGISPTLNTMTGGNRQPKIAVPVLTPDRINKRQNGRRFKTNGEPEFTLTGQDRHGVMTNPTRIRKLTPKECWRLQGFPDWAFDKAQQCGMSNSQLYKQAGNSVTVPVIMTIAERMGMSD
ncbi:modification methylase Rho11sI family protein [Lentilactobacillus rapi DSM 19907 = JCM 15042]|nr:DNA cytosine methyltransferase [Lentilactobacillus rapi]KRL17644.1 modification methylase Rho11sI family protein [Lentilactobacillus rapi DSM 19907 = JCM 15042]